MGRLLPRRRAGQMDDLRAGGVASVSSVYVCTCTYIHSYIHALMFSKPGFAAPCNRRPDQIFAPKRLRGKARKTKFLVAPDLSARPGCGERSSRLSTSDALGPVRVGRSRTQLEVVNASQRLARSEGGVPYPTSRQ